MTEWMASPSSDFMSILAIARQVREAASLTALADAVITGLRKLPGIANVAVIGHARSGEPTLWIGDHDFAPEAVQAFLDGNGTDPFDIRRQTLTGTIIDIPIAGSARLAATIRALVTGDAPSSTELALFGAVISMRIAALGIDVPLSEHVAPRRLSERQYDIVLLVARGCTNAEIAGMVGCSPHSVKKHLSRICLLLDVSNRTELAALAARWSPTRTGAATQHRVFRRTIVEAVS